MLPSAKQNYNDSTRVCPCVQSGGAGISDWRDSRPKETQGKSGIERDGIQPRNAVPEISSGIKSLPLVQPPLKPDSTKIIDNYVRASGQPTRDGIG